MSKRERICSFHYDEANRKYGAEPYEIGEELVRCKECRYCKRKRGTFKGEPIIFYRCTENNRDVESDDFCSWGERRSDE